MTTKNEILAYRARWQAVTQIELQELRTTSIETKWQQLNSIIGLAIRLGIFTADPSEEVVYQRWARLKEKADQPQK